MSENDVLVAITIVLIVLMIATFFYSKSYGIINGVVFCLYAFPLYYSILFKGNGGSSFLWWFYLMVFISIQILTVCIYLIYKIIKTPKSNKSTSKTFRKRNWNGRSAFWGYFCVDNCLSYCIFEMDVRWI